mgnify:CR=1 FL=1
MGMLLRTQTKLVIKGNIMSRVTHFVKRVVNFIRLRYKRILVLLGLVVLGTICALETYNKGFELGRRVGHCELACSATGGSFTGFEYDSFCQCELNNGFYINLPLNHEFY